MEETWETWNVGVWCDNDEAVYWEKIRFLRRNEKPTADDVEGFVRGVYPNGTPDMNHAKELDKVDWEELANEWASE